MVLVVMVLFSFRSSNLVDGDMDLLCGNEQEGLGVIFYPMSLLWIKDESVFWEFTGIWMFRGLHKWAGLVLMRGVSYGNQFLSIDDINGINISLKCKQSISFLLLVKCHIYMINKVG